MGNDFERYLQKVIHSLEKATEDEKLLALCGRLDDLTAAQILQSDGDLGGLYREIGKHLAFLKNARYGVRPFDNDDVVRGAETFRTVLFLFEEGIRHCSLVTILKAIFIYQWFDLPYRFLRDNLEANIYIDNELLLTEVNGVISKLKGEMNLPEKIPYGDGKFLEEYEVGVATEDLIKVYSFVSAIEKGAALRLSSILEHFIRFNYVFNLNAIKQHFNQLIEPYEIIIFLSVLQLEGEFPSLVTKETCNPWLIIEVIRQTLRGYETLPSAVISELPLCQDSCRRVLSKV